LRVFEIGTRSSIRVKKLSICGDVNETRVPFMVLPLAIGLGYPGLQGHRGLIFVAPESISSRKWTEGISGMSGISRILRSRAAMLLRMVDLNCKSIVQCTRLSLNVADVFTLKGKTRIISLITDVNHPTNSQWIPG
jgi:hypothetical protein